MKIVHIIPESFLEYENHISMVLFSFLCNIKCSFCFNYDFVSDPDKLIGEIGGGDYSLIDRNMNPLIDGLVFLGGEPTIYGKELFEISHYAKNTYNLDIKLFTNGTNPDIILEGLEQNFFDAVSIDYKSVYNYNNTINTDNLGSTFQDFHRNLVNLLEQISSRGFASRVEVRTTRYDGMTDVELELIKKTCNSLNLKHETQLDMSENYHIATNF
jgi:pyruvate formate lyase activating enzyme